MVKLNLIKRENASELALTVMKWAVVSLLLMRSALALLDYPSIGKGDWHIAHALTGGLVMWLGAMVNYIYYGSKIKRVSAMIFGIGLGLFVDEIGKYLSRDNNYFFQPAFSFIYVFFIICFLIYRYLERSVPQEPKTILFQIMDKLEELAENDLELSEKMAMLKKLTEVAKRGDEKTMVLALELKRMVEKIEAVEDKKDSWLTIWWKKIRGYSYHRVFKRKWGLRILLGLAVAYIAGGIIDSWYIITRFDQNWLFNWRYGDWALIDNRDLRIFGTKAMGDVISSGLFLMGIYWWGKGKKIKGLRFFQHGLMINIFITSVFKFYFEQFSGVLGVIVSVVILEGVKRLKRDV